MGEGLKKYQGLIYGGLLALTLMVCLYKGYALWLGFLGVLVIICGSLLLQEKTYRPIVNDIVQGIFSVKRIYLMIILIGFNIALWISSGVVPSMIFYGFEVIGHVHFLLFTFLMTALMALFMGTGLGTLSTVGVALFTLGSVMTLPGPLVLGFILSGAYVADRLSPLSALVQFTCETNRIAYKDYARKVAKAMLPAFILTLLMCFILGGKQAVSGQGLVAQIVQYKTDLGEHFFLHPLLMLVPLLVLVEVVRSGNSQRALYLGTGLGMFLTLFLQHQSLWQVLRYMLVGYRADQASGIVKTLEIGGGIGMLEVIVIIMLGMALSSLYEKRGWFDPLINQLIYSAKTPQQLVRRTAFLSIGLDALTCDQTIGIVIPSKTCLKPFNKQGQSSVDLAQVIANSGTAFSPLMPWNVNAIIILAITGIGAVDYAPYMILNWSTLILIIIFQVIFKNRTGRLNTKGSEFKPIQTLDKS